MSKLPKEALELFNQDITLILSQERLSGYDNNLHKHNQNLSLAMEVGKRISILEIYLRNKLDYCLKQIIGEDWIRSEKSQKLITAKSNKSPQSLTPPQALSTLMLGEVIELIRAYEIETLMFDLRAIKFKKYHWSNYDYFLNGRRKTPFSGLSKNIIVFNLLRTIRNRAFHWENLLKTREINGEIFPRITHREKGTIIGVMPEMIVEFLEDLIRCIGNPEIDKSLREIIGD